MKYREFGRTGMMVSAVGMGANRFPADHLITREGMEDCAELVVRAAKLGVNFFDSAKTYSGGKCEDILRIALPQIKEKCYICGKSSSYQERTADAVVRSIEASLERMNIPFFDVFYMWSVKSFNQYMEIMSVGGPFEGLQKAKDQGLVKHICFSSHATAEDSLRIIQEGTFEGVLVSYSLLSVQSNGIVLDAARQQGIGVAIMNPLGGGIIPQNKNMFANAILSGDRDVTDAAMKFVYANPAVSTVLSGVSSEEELISNTISLSEDDCNQTTRQKVVLERFTGFPEFCSGCNYCAGCPKGIPISTIMKAYNATKFNAESFIYNRSSTELRKKVNFFRELDGVLEFENHRNPCVKCGKCQKVCTQSLPITKILEEIYSWSEECCVSIEDRKRRLKELIPQNSRRVGVYTAGVYTAYMLKIIKKLQPGIKYEILVFDSDPLKWGTLYLDQYLVRKPEEMEALKLDVLLITNYIHMDEIYRELISRFRGVNIKKLHKENDVPWYF